MTTQFAASLAEATADNIENNGGSSIKLSDLSTPTTGYMVSFQNPTLVMVSPSRASMIDNTAAFLLSNASFAESRDDLYLGGWRNDRDGLVYIDFSLNILTLSEAITFGREQNQVAIFEVETGNEIYL